MPAQGSREVLGGSPVPQVHGMILFYPGRGTTPQKLSFLSHPFHLPKYSESWDPGPSFPT